MLEISHTLVQRPPGKWKSFQHSHSYRTIMTHEPLAIDL